MARRKMFGGFDETGNGWILLVCVLALAGIVAFLVLATKKEKFVTAPSATGDQQEVTPAGNVILY